MQTSENPATEQNMTTGSRQRITDFLAPRMGGAALGAEDDLFRAGGLNSLFAVQLVRFVEREFHIVLESEDMEFNNFRTINAICDLVDRKQLDRAGSGRD